MTDQETRAFEAGMEELRVKGITPPWLRRMADLFDSPDGYVLGEREDGGYDYHSCSPEKAGRFRLLADALTVYLDKEDALALVAAETETGPVAWELVEEGRGADALCPDCGGYLTPPEGAEVEPYCGCEDDQFHKNRAAAGLPPLNKEVRE